MHDRLRAVEDRPMTTPAEYRALAARVMAGENTDDLNEYIFNATAPHGDGIKHRLWQDMNGKMRVPYGMFFRDLNAADALMARFGHNVAVTIRQYVNANWIAEAMLLHPDGDCVQIEASAPTEAAARVALALLCRAAEGER